MTKITDDARGIAHIWVLFAVVLLVVGGAGYTVMKHNQSQQLNKGGQTSTVSQVKPLSANLDGLLTTDKVQEIAAQDAPGTKVSQIGLVQTSNGPVFHVQLEDGSSLDLDAKTGTKVSTSEVSDNPEGGKMPANFMPSIDFAKARQIAQGQVTRGSITRIELETEDGAVVYSVRFSTGAKVLISATDGSVVKVDAAQAQGKQPTSSDSSSGEKTGSDSSSKGESGSSDSKETQTSGSGGDSQGGSDTSGDSGSSSSSSSGSGGGSSDGGSSGGTSGGRN